MKIAFIAGARPNFIKLAPLFDIIDKYSDIQPVLIHTGQHYDAVMSDIFFDELKLPKPDFNLNVGSGLHGKQTAEILAKLEELFIEISPDLIVVIGDVNSTLAGALAAAKLNIRCAHIEAGLRSFNKTMPEEINRIVADHICDMLFAPSQAAMLNLSNEGLLEKSYFTGDLMYDAVLRNLPIAESKSKILEKLNLTSKGYFFVTLHRPYNVDNPDKLRKILEELGRSDSQIVFSAHPRTRKIIENNGIRFQNNIKLIEPVGYLDSITLQKNAIKVITDSGGIQKEAFFLKTPCITLRPETEWIETVKCGANILCDVENLSSVINNTFASSSFDSKPYGNGKSAEIILDLIGK